MCGIAGQISFTRPLDPADVQGMTDRLMHRGPDDGGLYRSSPDALPSVVLGQRRLSIIDLSEAGHQPMPNEDQTLWIVFNGEIYNFQDLRKDLIQRGHRFRSQTDTEVLLRLYEAYGTACLAMLRGMFAFAIWDGPKERLFLARDRIGKKPLYYTRGQGAFSFASEIQALYGLPEVGRDLDPEALDLYLTFSYIPSPHSVFRDIRKLPPAHCMLIEKDRVLIERYWTLRFLPKSEISFEEAQTEFLERLGEATRVRMISDVPLGCFLSGGVDSSLVVAMMARASSGPVKTFTIGFSDTGYDERPHARQVAEIYGTEHQTFEVRPDAANILPRLVEHYGEPYGDASALPTWYVSQLTRTRVTVALNGDGGDESFAGYNWYATALALARWGWMLPRPLARLLYERLGGLQKGGDWGRKVVRLAELLSLSEVERFADLRSLLPRRRKAALYSPLFRESLAGKATDWIRRAYEACDSREPLDCMACADINTYLSEELLVKIDRATMAHGLEGRSPFLDHVFMEWAARLPSSFKYARGTRKRIIKAACAGLFPKGFLDRPKTGFAVPLDAWFRGPLGGMARERLLHGPLGPTGLLDMGTVGHILDDHRRGVRAHGELIWRLLMLALWMERFLA